MRKILAVAAMALALTVPGTPALADSSGTCPDATTGAEFGAHASAMARAGHLGPNMSPGMHRGFSPMAH